MNIPRRDCITLLGSAVSAFLCVSAAAQEGYYGVGHDKWHEGFYSKLRRNDGQGSCCNLMDCRPTQIRTVGNATKSRWTANGRQFLTTRSMMWSRRMVVLMSALPCKKVGTKGCCSASFFLRRADPKYGRRQLPTR
jgi:hypothetical protein